MARINPSTIFKYALTAALMGLCMIVVIFLYVFTLFPSAWARKKSMLFCSYILLLPSRILCTPVRFINIPKEPSIIFTHHATALETVYIYHKINPCTIIKRETLFTPFLGSICAFTVRAIWIKRIPSQLRSILEQTKHVKDTHVLIFSEGTRASFHAPVRSKSLVYFLAKQHPSMPLVPLVHNTHVSFTTHTIVPHARRPITFQFLPPINPSLENGRSFLATIDKTLDKAKASLPCAGANIDSLSVHTLKDYLDRKIPLCILDVRTEEERAKASLPHTHHVAQNNLLYFCTTYLETHTPHTVFAILCHHGIRSARATAYLRAHGFTACNISGGIDAWSKNIDASIPSY